MLKPLGDRVLVRPSKGAEQTASGIVLPDNARKKPTEGEVLALGSGRILDNGRRVPISLKEGDTVIYAKYAGSEVTIEEEDLILIDEDSILAVRE
ncbi:MAG: co-chaperone GroES [Armatimonadetes bacterium]|nr:co-chaperone GroES [Armatimonadota bacterium]